VFCKEGLSNDDQQFQQYQLHEQLSLSPQHTKTKIHADGNADPGPDYKPTSLIAYS
jgi:hypothetical protein